MPYHVTEGGGVGCDLDLPRVWLNLLPDPQARSFDSEDSAISNPVTAPVGANSPNYGRRRHSGGCSKLKYIIDAYSGEENEIYDTISVAISYFS
ncbi:hypothetical protein TNCV_2938931 [Trichonephila clavipes]|nr:hypothetical protein TNCV_2938931 [Trichonephila clavipes]